MVIDGHSLAFRAFYALPVDSFVNQSGQHTNAIHGFIAMLLSLLQQEKPDAIAVAFDISRHSFRTDEYPEYKGNRGETPAEFKGQVPLLQEALQALGIRTFEKVGYEADDILATLATEGEKAGYEVLVVSGDRDTIQLVTPTVTLLYPASQGVSKLKRYTPETVFERYGVEPYQYPEIAALVGETSDNLPGIPKVGEKTAVKWINQFGSFEEIMARKDEIGGKVGENLREFAHLAERNRKLNQLVRDVDLGVTLDELARQPIDLSRVTDVFAKLDFRTLLTRVKKLAAANGEVNGETAISGAAEGAVGGSARTAASNSAAAATGEGGAAAAGQGTAAGENSGAGANGLAGGAKLTPPAPVHLVDEELAAWLAKQENPVVCFEFVGGDAIPVGVATETEAVEFVWQPGKRDFVDFEAWLAGSAAKSVWDLKVTSKQFAGLDKTLAGVVDDATIALHVYAPHAPQKTVADAVLTFLSEVIPQPDTEKLLPEEDETLSLSAQAWYIKRVITRVKSLFSEGTQRVYEQIELPLAPVLAKLELRGVAIDRAALEAQLADTTAEVMRLQDEAFAAIGRQVNLASPKQLQEVLFEQLQMPKTRKIKSGYSTDATSLTELHASHPHPFLEALLAHRAVNKLKQIIETLLKAIDDDGRIHTTLLQLGARTGRMASADPNLQNIPVRSEAGKRIREGFTHGEEFESLFTADYSQIEMRIMAHLSGDDDLIAAFRSGEDLHRYVGSRIFGVTPAEVTPEMRAKVKAMSYGLVYGLSAYGLAKQLGIKPEEAKQLMTDYFKRFGRVRDFLRAVVAEATEVGYTETINGRRCPFPDLASPNRVIRANAERAALNAPIQGSAADIIKIAMIDIENQITAAGLKSQMVLQIHDELMFEVAPGEREQLEEIVRKAMGNAQELLVPLEVSVGAGNNWEQAAH